MPSTMDDCDTPMKLPRQGRRPLPLPLLLLLRPPLLLLPPRLLLEPPEPLQRPLLRRQQALLHRELVLLRLRPLLTSLVVQAQEECLEIAPVVVTKPVIFQTLFWLKALLLQMSIAQSNCWSKTKRNNPELPKSLLPGQNEYHWDSRSTTIQS